MNKQEYPSGTILMEVAKSEYENEKDRTSVIDSKANIVITLGSVFFIAMIQGVSLKKLIHIKMGSFADAIIPLVSLAIIICAVVIGFLALIFFLKVIFTKPYGNVDSKYFYDIDKLKNSADYFAIAVSKFYIEATEINKVVNDNRVKFYQRGIILLIISLALFTFYTLFSCVLI